MIAAEIRHYAIALEALHRVHGTEPECETIHQLIRELIAEAQEEQVKRANPIHVSKPRPLDVDDEIPF